MDSGGHQLRRYGNVGLHFAVNLQVWPLGLDDFGCRTDAFLAHVGVLPKFEKLSMAMRGSTSKRLARSAALRAMAASCSASGR